MRLSNMSGMRVAAAVLMCAAAANGQEIFEFHSGYWTNLHQFLMRQASLSDPAQSDAATWRDAVDYYRREMAKRDVLSAEMKAIEDRLSAAGSAEALPSGLDPGLVAVLRGAAPAYRKNWWPEHDRGNREWIAAAQPLVAKYGAAVRKDIAAAYQVKWQAGPIRTDVAAFAGPVGGYTTAEPAHITISSTDAGYRGMAALEMLFHEASHTIDEKVNAALQAELKARGRLLRRRRFDHAILFYTAGETVRKYVPGYEQYGVRNGVLEQGWPGGLEVLEKDWKPYLEGKVGLDAAVRAVVEDYGVPAVQGRALHHRNGREIRP